MEATTVLTLPVMTFDLGGSVADGPALRAHLDSHGLDVTAADEEALWRRAYSLGRGEIVQIDRGLVELPVDGLGSVRVQYRIHPVGVVAVRLWVRQAGQEGLHPAYELNNRIAAWRDDVGESFFNGVATGDDVIEQVTRLQKLAAPFVDPRPGVSRRNALNTLQVVELAPGPDEPATRAWIEQFSAVQGAPLGPDGGIMTAPHLRIARWREAVIAHAGGGQTLLLTADERHLADAVSAYERVHVLRFWLRTCIDVLDGVDAPEPRARRLSRNDVRRLSVGHLRLTDLHSKVTRSLAEVDDRNIPASSIFGRQLTLTLSDMFEIEGWKTSVLERLDAAAIRNGYIGTVLDREFQLSTQRQSEKLQLLFAGSLAATVMALLPALLALTRPREPVWPWIMATGIGTLLIWGVTVYLVLARWKVEVFLDATQGDDG